MPHTALITGAGKRVGRHIALSLAEAGHDVVVHYNASDEAAREVVAEIRAKGRSSVAVQADLLDESQTATLVDRAAQAIGAPITLLVNNASIFEHDSYRTATRDSWDRHIESNLRAPFVLTQGLSGQIDAALTDAHGESRAAGLVINIIDQRVRKLTPGFASYTIAKAGLWTLTQTAAQALAPRIRVNAIAPGPTLQGYGQPDAHFAHQRRNTILERGSNPDDIAGAVLYFIGATAVTGQLLCVDGGQHLTWQTRDTVGPD